jgi:hypothetical protein
MQTTSKPRSKAARQQGSKAARQQGCKAARQQGSKAARQQDSKTARQQGSKAASNLDARHVELCSYRFAIHGCLSLQLRATGVSCDRGTSKMVGGAQVVKRKCKRCEIFK